MQRVFSGKRMMALKCIVIAMEGWKAEKSEGRRI